MARRAAVYRILDHTADVGIVAHGKDLPQTFANVARGMFSLLVDRRRVRRHTRFSVKVDASDLEGLLVAWLEELLFRFETEGVLLTDFQISHLDPGHLEAVVGGEAIDLAHHSIKIGIKAVTYHQLKIERKDGYRAQVIFDI